MILSVPIFSESDNYVFSAGVHHLIDLGIGVTLKNIHANYSSLQSTGSAKDFGVQARVPIIEIFEYMRKQELFLANQWRLRFDISTGMAWSNRGDEFTFTDVNESDPLPAYRRIGWTGVLGISWKQDSTAWEVFKITSGLEKYTPQVGGIEEPGTADNMKGIEISFFEILDIRRGKYDDKDGRRHLDTGGYTLKSDGLFRIIQVIKQRESQQNHWFNFFADHLSISWTQFSQSGEPFLSRTSHAEFKFLF